MRVGVIPDIHGNKNFEQKIESLLNEGVDKIIFLGDYCDSHVEGNKWPVQKECLDKILERKKANPDFYSVLFGNHDQHYLLNYGADTHVSGRQWWSAPDIQEYFIKNYKYFQMIEVIDKWIFSHAGISKAWLVSPNSHPFGYPEELNWTLEDINSHFQKKDIKYFNHHSNDPYGDDLYEGCTWIRPPSLIRYGLTGYNQCIGHTALEEGPNMDYWNLDSRIITGQEYWDKKFYYSWQYEDGVDNLDNKYVFLDSPDQSYYSIIDTVTNDVKIMRIGEENGN